LDPENKPEILTIQNPTIESEGTKQITKEEYGKIVEFLNHCLDCPFSKFHKHGEDRQSQYPKENRLAAKYVFLGYMEDKGVDGLCCTKAPGCQKTLLNNAVNGTCPLNSPPVAP
jgi:hypothetical protein